MEALNWVTPEGISVKPLYTAADLQGLPHADTLPGFEPFVRGPQATMYAVRPWTIRQYAGFSTAEETNAFYRKALAAGGQGVSVAFDLATHRGYDSDHPRVTGDVGKAGVAIDSVEDMKILFDGIPLDKVSVSHDDERRGAAGAGRLRGGGRRAGRGAGPAERDHPERHPQGVHGPQHLHLPARAEHADHRRHHRVHGAEDAEVQLDLASRGYHMQEAGANQALELAFTLADGKEYVKTALAKGLDVDDFAGRLSFFWAIGMNFYLEIAKMRAARLLWCRIMKGFGAKNPKSLMLRTHCQTSGWSLTEQDPYNNVVRTTIEAMAAVFGGTQSLHTNSFDEAIALPTEFSVAHRAQHPADHPGRDAHHQRGRPLGRQLHDGEADAGHGRRGLGHHRGGRGHGRHDQGRRFSGWAKLKIEASAAEKQARIDSGKDVIVGVNKYKLQARRRRSRSARSTTCRCATARSRG